MTTIAVLPGDGIGPEIAAPASGAQRAPRLQVEFTEYVFGGASIDAHGTALTDETLAGCRAADAVLLAAVGGPKWDTTDPNAPRPEQGLLGIRKELGLFANIRPVRPIPALYSASALKPEIIEGTNLVVVRELTGGIYFGEKTRTETSASDLCAYTTAEVDRIARVAFELAGRRSASSPPSTKPTCSRPRASGGRSSTRSPPSTRPSNSRTSSSTTAPCSSSRVRRAST